MIYDRFWTALYTYYYVWQRIFRHKPSESCTVLPPGD